MNDKPIAGVNLEAEQVVEEEAEKPITAKRKRPYFLIFGVILVAEAIVLFFVFGTAGASGSDKPLAFDASEIGKTHNSEYWHLSIDEVKIAEPNLLQPGRQNLFILDGVNFFFDEEEVGKDLRKLFESKPSIETFVKGELAESIKRFMHEQGGETLMRREELLGRDLHQFFKGLDIDGLAGLPSQILDIHVDSITKKPR